MKGDQDGSVLMSYLLSLAPFCTNSGCAQGHAIFISREPGLRADFSTRNRYQSNTDTQEGHGSMDKRREFPKAAQAQGW